MIKLYWSPRSRSFSAIWLLEETGLPYERVLTDTDRRATRRNSGDQPDGQGAG